MKILITDDERLIRLSLLSDAGGTVSGGFHYISQAKGRGRNDPYGGKGIL